MNGSAIVEEFTRLAIGTVPWESKRTIRSRTADLMRHRTEGNLDQYIGMFTQDSILFDADGRTIRGKDEIMLYSEVSFEYGRERDGQAFVLQSTNILADRSSASTIYDIGDYDWSNVESGRYIHKWVWDSDNFYLQHVYFTIDHMIPAVPLLDGNIVNGYH